MRVFATSRFISLAVTASLLAPPLAEMRHSARTAHVACPIDGRIEDATDLPPQLPHSHSAGVVLPGLLQSNAHSHRACEATPTARLRTAAACAARGDALRLALARTTVGPRDTPRIPTLDLVRLAPKLSPPLS